MSSSLSQFIIVLISLSHCIAQPTSNCTECPSISLISIGNISITSCPLESDCECTDGLVSFTVKYLNEVSAASTITFYRWSKVACPLIEDVSNEEEIVCTIDIEGINRFSRKTKFTIEYEDSTIADCSGSFDTSCTGDILGEFGNGCSDLVITSWTDQSGGICTGNISLTEPVTTVADTSSIDTDSDTDTDSKYWQYKDASESSSASNRRRLFSINGDSSDSTEYLDTWYNNKKCIPNCVQWGLQRGLSCGCYQECEVNTLSSSCFSVVGGGYCTVGTCCCAVDETSAPTTPSPTTATPTTAIPTTAGPTTSKPTTAIPTTAIPTTSNPTTANPTTANPTTTDPTTALPTTVAPTTAVPTTATPTFAPITPSPTFTVCATNDSFNIAFLIDESGSVDENEWQNQIEFVDRLIEYDVPSTSTVSLFEFASPGGYSHFLDWTEVGNNRSVFTDSLNNNHYNPDGFTYTWEATNRVLDEFWDYRFTCDDGCDTRSDVLIIVTDGRPTDNVCPRIIPRINQSDVDIIVIGIQMTPAEISNISCLDYKDGGADIFSVDSFDEVTLNSIELDVREKTCDGAHPATPSIRPVNGTQWVYEDGSIGLGPIPTKPAEPPKNGTGDTRRLIECTDTDTDSSALRWVYSYIEWYQDRCGITSDASGYADIFGSSSQSSSGDGTRRRQLLAASSSSSSSSASFWSVSDDVNDFLIETCVQYEIGVIADCMELMQIFLPLCENQYTDFNSTNLNASDITGLITDGTFETKSNVLSAIGEVRNGVLGLLVTLTDPTVSYFEICVGNVTVDAQDIDALDITTIDTSLGSAIFDNNGTAIECSIDGLPCFNFFFDAECPMIEEEIYRSCDCEDGVVSMEFEYIGTEPVTATFIRDRKRSILYNTMDATYSKGDTITVESAPYTKFKEKTRVVLADTDGNVVCSGRIQRCETSMIGSTVSNCDDLVLVSWSAGDGALCDEIALQGSSSDESDANVFMNNKDELQSVWKVFEELDPFIKYSLIGIVATFVFCLCFFGYCVCNQSISKQSNVSKKEVQLETVVKGTANDMIKVKSLSQ